MPPLLVIDEDQQGTSTNPPKDGKRKRTVIVQREEEDPEKLGPEDREESRKISKRRRLEEVRKRVEVNPKLQPPKSNSKSVKELIQQMAKGKKTSSGGAGSEISDQLSQERSQPAATSSRREVDQHHLIGAIIGCDSEGTSQLMRPEVKAIEGEKEGEVERQDLREDQYSENFLLKPTEEL